MPFHPDAQWISGPAYEYGADNAGYYQNHPNHVLVRRFTVTPCKTAELHIAVLGYARVMLNGRPITDAELLGDWTNPTKVVYYDTFDVASLLHEGENTLVVELGNGWYNPSPLTMFGKYNLRARLAEVGTPKALVELNVNGETLLVSDDQWSCSEGKLLFNNVYLGETRDLAHEANELDIVCEPNVRNLESSVVERCRRFEPVEPAVLRELDNGSLDLVCAPVKDVTLHAVASDPDKDELHISWFRYAEADTCDVEATLEVKDSTCLVRIPNTTQPKDTVHVICRVTDEGDGRDEYMVAYARVVITVE